VIAKASQADVPICHPLAFPFFAKFSTAITAVVYYLLLLIGHLIWGCLGLGVLLLAN
jgi:hypothetical protein